MSACENYRLGCTCGDCQRTYFARHAHSCTYGPQLVACYCGRTYQGLMCPGCLRATPTTR